MNVKRANKVIQKLLDEIVAILKREKRTVADLARDLKLDYHQVYDWVILRKFNPRATALMRLQAWRDEHMLPDAVSVSAAK
jgi:transposase-like protein